MEQIVLVYLSGLRANQRQTFPLEGFKELILGRDPAAHVKFDEATETMVGRQHARITRNLAFPTQFFITDLNSRNGTFVNGLHIQGVSPLKPGDIIQCGADGPKFLFSAEFESAGSVEPTPAITKAVESPKPITSAIEAEAQNRSAQSTSLEYAINPGETSSRKRLYVGVGVFLGIVALLTTFVLLRGRSSAKHNGATAGVASPNAGVGQYDHAHHSGGPAAASEKDPARTIWKIDVAPAFALGSGRPGKAASDFDKPDGVAFSPDGLLFATDAKNRRVQIWDVKTGAHLAEFGHGVFGGEIVDVAIGPDKKVFVTDQTLNLAYVFTPPVVGALDEKGKPFGQYDYQFQGTLFGEQGFQKLGGIVIDSRRRIYAVDAHRNEVMRFTPDGKIDKSWKFQRTRADGDTFLHGCEGIAIDEASRNLFVASEKDAVIEVFDWETGAYKRQVVGAAKDAADKPTGQKVFFGSVEGLAITQQHLLAVDESAGHIQIFNLTKPDVFNTDLAGYPAPHVARENGYRGYFGAAPLVDFEDKSNLALHQQVKTGAIIPGQANPLGHFCSPDSITSYSDPGSGETYIAIADQCNYRLVVYRWSDIAKAMGAEVLAVAPSPTSTAAPVAAAAVATTPAAVAAIRRARVIRPRPRAIVRPRVVAVAPKNNVASNIDPAKKAKQDKKAAKKLKKTKPKI
jgi:pSer/pThr/pTyr-binding forkhead associated (FHA) protein/sugar lactone lactonase YvrE